MEETDVSIRSHLCDILICISRRAVTEEKKKQVDTMLKGIMETLDHIENRKFEGEKT